MRDSVIRIVLEENKSLNKLIFFFADEPKGYELEYYILKSRQIYIEEYLKSEFYHKFINIGNVSFMEFNKNKDYCKGIASFLQAKLPFSLTLIILQ